MQLKSKPIVEDKKTKHPKEIKKKKIAYIGKIPKRRKSKKKKDGKK